VNKVHGGTRGTVRLCDSCANSHIIRGSRISQESISCSGIYPPRVVPFDVVECKDYRNAAEPSLGKLMEIAQFISVDKRTGRVGFVDASKISDEDKEKVYEASPL
jgi:hypothetical protein